LSPDNEAQGVGEGEKQEETSVEEAGAFQTLQVSASLLSIEVELYEVREGGRHEREEGGMVGVREGGKGRERRGREGGREGGRGEGLKMEFGKFGMNGLNDNTPYTFSTCVSLPTHTLSGVWGIHKTRHSLPGRTLSIWVCRLCGDAE
jgi:hypothetical protein